jgi:hypothetical protein
MNKPKIVFNKDKGIIEDITMDDVSILVSPVGSTSIENLTLTDVETISASDSCTKIKLTESSLTHKVTSYYEIYKKGYVICTFEIETMANNNLNSIELGIRLKNNPVFMNSFEIKNMDKEDVRRYPRAISINFSMDGRRITNSLDYMLENVHDGYKFEKPVEKGRFLGWHIENSSLSTSGGKYRNRWCLHTSAIDNSPNKVRGQRIYHWYGHYPALPTVDLIEEMNEYGCSILILHMPSFKWIDGSKPINEEEFQLVIEKAHSFGIKMMFYMQPLLISQSSPMHESLTESLIDNGKLCWHSLKNTQIVFYEPNSDYDCDELCLRCPKAYSYVKKYVMECYKKYQFDGLYIDFAWPSIAVCTDESHGHDKGIFNFYDYLRMIRELREKIGDDAIMIGHGGSLLVPSDYAEGFDACLTGEGQKDLLPEVIGVQTGTAPTLWTMHRRKEKQFRSREAMAGIIREGLTPHIGLGILGKSIMATLDPAHTPHYIALWQMWRSFPVEKAKFYNYLTETVVELDNSEVTYSLYVTDKNQILLIVCNKGGPKSENSVSVELNIKLDHINLGLSKNMKSVIMRGNTYETFRAYNWEDISEGAIHLPEIGINEFVGFVLYEKEIPDETVKLIKHLEKRHERMSVINEKKIERLMETDKLLDQFNKLDLDKLNADDFMKNRVME